MQDFSSLFIRVYRNFLERTRKGEAVLFRQDEPVVLESSWIPEYPN